MSTQPVAAPRTAPDFMPLHGIDHVELWVGNAKQAAHYFTRAFGFQEVAYAGLETGLRDRTSHVLKQGRIRLVLTGALTPGHEIAQHHAAHGDGARVIALSVPDAAYAYHAAVERGATGVREPWEESDEHGTVRFSQHRHLRRHAAHVRRAQGLHRPVPPRLRGRARTPRPTPACSRSTTSSATSSSAT